MYVRTRLPLAAGGTVLRLRRRTSSTLATATSHIPHAWKYLTRLVLRHFYVVLVVSTVPKKKKLFAGTSQNFTPSTHVHTEVRRTYVRLAAKR